MLYKDILYNLTLVFILALTACGGSGGGGGDTPSGSIHPGSDESSVIRANTYNAQGDLTGYKLTTLNSANNPTRETYHDNDGQPLSSIEYIYDGLRLTGRIHLNARGEITTRTSISYAGPTRNSTRRTPDNTLLSYTITTTNNARQITREDTYTPNGNLREYTIYIYDGDSVLIERRRHAGADLELMTYTRYRYHPDGTLRSEHTYDAADDLVDYTTYTYGRGDALDNPADSDGDGIADARDNCPAIANRDQNNTVTPGDAEGDACEDSDGDNVYDIMDNCPTIANAGQANLDSDAAGDACDPLTSITNTTTLQAITNGNYQITTNLSVLGPWTPIDNFRGTLNGDNHTITFHTPQFNLALSNLNPPLFFFINSTATVTNIGILNSTLADINRGTIRHSYATGDSFDIDDECGGGLVGFNLGAITNSYATGNSISSDILFGGSVSSGGLVGCNTGTITNSYATGNSRSNNASGSYSYSGGLVGLNFLSGTITNSYATGNSHTSGSVSVSQSGGLVGFNQGAITNSYATGNSHSSGGGNRNSISSGGLVGFNNGRITNSYATGNSHSDDFSRSSSDDFSQLYSGGLVGHNYIAIITNSYATGNSSTSRSDGLSVSYSGGLVGANSDDPGGFDDAIITNSYRVQIRGNTFGTAITLPNLRAVTSFSGWSTSIWDFGTTSQLPRHHNRTGIPLCPGAASYSDTSCRW